MQRMSRLKSEIARWRDIQTRINDAIELAELGDESMESELTAEAETLHTLVEKMSFEALMSGKYDNQDAIFSIHAGAGGWRSFALNFH